MESPCSYTDNHAIITEHHITHYRGKKRKLLFWYPLLDIFYKQVQISRLNIRPHIKWAVSLVILHMVTSVFLQGLCGYIWVNIVTLSPQRGVYNWNVFIHLCTIFPAHTWRRCEHHNVVYSIYTRKFTRRASKTRCVLFAAVWHEHGVIIRHVLFAAGWREPGVCYHI